LWVGWERGNQHLFNIGPRSLLLFLENLCRRSSDFISLTILTKLYTSVRYGKTSYEFAFHDAASKVKVTVTIFRKSLSSL
jgi:hypothetical protein